MKRPLLLFLTASAAVCVNAKHMSPDEALYRAMNIQADAIAGSTAMAMAHSPELVYSAEINSLPMAYVFNSPGQGYMIISADDTTPAILGYSETASFDPNNMPDNLRTWIDGYARQIAWIAEHPTAAAPVSTAVKQRAEVAPKLKTTWDQGSPYNDLCPTKNGRACYTGCVATAMAQIMNYHQWPDKPKGSITYIVSGSSYSMDFDGITFEWDKMLDSYTTKSPEENRTAVATLMKACGHASQMNYSTSGSGAASYIAAAGLVKYFDYDTALSLQRREWFGIEEWADLVYKELTTNGPVYYDGSGTGGGHAFVCDGYRAEDGFFHFNWGWSGMSDGYFRLSLLSPGEQGAGGVSEGYNWDQSIICGLRKPQADSKPTYIYAPYAGLRLTITKQALGKNANFLGYETSDGFVNYSVFDMASTSLGIRVTNATSGETVMDIQSNNVKNAVRKAYTKQDNNILITLPTSLSDGSYILSPIFKSDNDAPWQKMAANLAFRNTVAMEVKGDSAYFSLGEIPAHLYIDQIQLPEYFTSQSPYTITARISNVGEKDFIGFIRGVFCSIDENNNIKVNGAGKSDQILIAAGTSMELEYTSPVSEGSISDGEYWFCFGNGTTGEIISDFHKAVVGNKYGSLILSYYNFNIENSTFVDRDKMHITATMSCPQGMYNGPIALLISQKRKPFNTYSYLLSDDYSFEAVETKDIDFTGAFPSGELGETYYAILGYKSTDGTFVPINDNPVAFTVGESSGIATVKADDIEISIYPNPAENIATVTYGSDLTTVNVYSLSGAQMRTNVTINGHTADIEVSHLPAGTYIVVATAHDHSRKAAKLIKR